MLTLKSKQAEYDWWIGYPIPTTIGYYCTLEASGHELTMILEAMRRAYVGPGGIVEFNPTPYLPAPPTSTKEPQ